MRGDSRLSAWFCASLGEKHFGDIRSYPLMWITCGYIVAKVSLHRGQHKAGRQIWRRMVDSVWQKAAERIRASLGEVAYETWISPLNFNDLHGRTATIEAP